MCPKVEVPESFTNTNAISEILGVRRFGKYQYCGNCNKKIPGDSLPAAVVKCSHCKLAKKIINPTLGVLFKL